MKILLLGSGGRESALAWGLARSPETSELFVAPGNPGTAELAANHHCDIGDPSAVVALTKQLRPDLVVIGPEAPLVAGVGDGLRADGCLVFGPDRAAAQIEGSKAHAKGLMNAAGIPTAAARSFSRVDEAEAFLDELGAPYVIKADGLAAGKGVVVTSDRQEASDALQDALVARRFGDAGASVLVEEFLDGPELSLIAFSDGTNIAVCEAAQDYKRVGEDDAGPNTGGMGSYSPVPACQPGLAAEIAETVVRPMVKETARRGAPFLGALYAGLALTSKGPRVIEFNARFGDPETQALIPRLDSSLAEMCAAAARGDLSGVRLRWSDDVCGSVVLSSAGYPSAYP
ncbi:MAG: phosphoribosylamine--glycine ligase, partial [Actinobacteria bacterium]|nr:phosphoribosylamine--glycine ligase [Actinomycetota bacterium]